MLQTLTLLHKSKSFSDAEVIEGLQAKSRQIENWFYSAAKSYFDEHFNDLFFDKDRKQEVFQSSLLKLWTEISDAKITVLDGTICRQQRNGEYQPMTCQLTTFLMAFAKTEYREMVRTDRLDTYADVYDNVDTSEMVTAIFTTGEDIEAQKNRIVDDCISTMSPRCMEVLTLFYYEGRSLDEILEIRKEKNSSKNGLKTAKNKCMNTLRDKITEEFHRYNIKIS